jgi:DNA repair protein SbcC/Rad50
MAFFSRFFKPKAPETVEQRIEGLQQFTAEQLADKAQNATEESVRLAAIKRLTFGQPLLKLASEDVSTSLKQAARKRIGELLDDQTLSINTLKQAVPDTSLLLALCGYSNASSLQLIEQIDDITLLTEIAYQGTTTQIRQAAAQKITDHAALEQLAKQAKIKDKSVYKIVRNKLDTHKFDKQKENQLLAEISAICHQAEQLTKRNLDEIFTARKLQIESAWQDFYDNATDDLRSRYQTAMEKCQQKINDALEQEKIIALARAAEKEAKKELHNAIQSLQEMLARFFTHEDPKSLSSELNEKIAQSEVAVQDAAAKGLNTELEKSQIRKLTDAIQDLAKELSEKGSFANLIQELQTAKLEGGKQIKSHINHLLDHAKHLSEKYRPAVIDQYHQTLDHWSAEIDTKSEQIKNSVRELTELVRKGNWAAGQGYANKARALLQEAERKLDRIEDLPAQLTSKYEEFKIAVEKLADWHEFATNPKKEDLIKKMQALVSTKLHPKELAEKIQTLQNEWKSLSRGGQKQDDQMWQEFHNAAQQAYEPCKLYFDEQNQWRTQNATARHALITHLTQYLNEYHWETANWKEVEKTLRVSREAWMTYWPVPHKEAKEIQTAFDLVMEQLNDKITQEHEKNRQKKQLIVNQAKALLDQSDTQAAIETAKKLQSQWRSIGSCKRKDDQILWHEFRGHCDAVFAKRQQESDAHKAERLAAKNQAMGIIEKLQLLLNSDSEAFNNAKNQLETLIAEFQSIGELPREDAKDLSNKFDRTIAEIHTKADREKQLSATKIWHDIFNFADQIRQCELQQLGQATQTGKTIEDLPEHIQPHWPNEVRDLFNLRIKNITNITVQDSALAELQLRSLCVKSEILTGRQTPEEDKALRMELQVKALQQNFGQTRTPTEDTMREAFNEWIAIPGATDTVYPTLVERFKLNWLTP